MTILQQATHCSMAGEPVIILNPAGYTQYYWRGSNYFTLQATHSSTAEPGTINILQAIHCKLGGLSTALFASRESHT